jgi:hypothetical protein
MADDEFTLRKAMERATQAQQLLDNDILKEAFSDYEAACLNAWKSAPPRDVDGRERLWQAVQVVGKVKSHLETMVANGQLSARQIERDFYTPRKRFGIV